MPTSGSAKSSSSVSSGSSGPPVCSDARYLYASGGENGSSSEVVIDPETGSRTWFFFFNHENDGAGFFVDFTVACVAGVVTVASRAIGTEVQNLCSSYEVNGTITIVSENPVLIYIDFPACLDVWIPGTITVSE